MGDFEKEFTRNVDNTDTVALSTFQRWLREQHKIHLDIRHNSVSHPKWFVCVMRIQEDMDCHIKTVDDFKSYEDALIGGILIALKGLK